MNVWKEVNTELKDLFKNYGNTIKPAHNYLKGSKNYAIATIENIVGHLESGIKNDDLLIFLNNSLINLIEEGEEFYYQTIRNVNKAMDVYDHVEEIIKEAKEKFGINVMSEAEKAIILEIANMNVNEYLMKSDMMQVDYSAMKTLSLMAYEVLIEGIYKYVSGISMVVNTDGYLDKWRLDYSEEKREHIWFDWKSSDKIDHYITIYDVNCSGLSRNSKLELASADAYEADYIKTEKSLGSYGILVKQYCGVIEQEINSLLMLSGSSDEHMMWGKLKERVRKNDIQLTGAWFDLYKMLDEIQKIRNLAMHGEEVSEKEFDILRKYRDRQLFEFISWTKLELEGIKHHPTVDEISEKFKV